MGKVIKYKFLTEDQPGNEQIFLEKEIICATEEAVQANIPVAEKEAYNGKYTIEDDGQPEPEPTPSGNDSAMWDELDAAYQEGVDSV